MNLQDTCQCGQIIFKTHDGHWFHDVAPQDYEHETKPMSKAEEEALMRDAAYDARSDKE